jgi:hypothetical protein
MAKPLGNPLDVASATLNGFHIRKLSEAIMDAIRVARLSLDYYAVWWLTREIIDLEDKEANDRLAFEMVQVFTGETEYDGLQKTIMTEYAERRATWTSLDDAAKPGAKGKVDTHPIATLEQFVEVMKQNQADPAYTTNEKIDMSFRERQMKNILDRVRAKVHDYLVKVEARLTFEERNSDVFDEHIAAVNELIDAYAPEVAAMFTAAYDRLDDTNPESLHQAATSCRRILKAVADHLYPAGPNIVDTSGIEREVGVENYVNRLLAYAEGKLPGTVGEAWRASLNDLSARLDALFKVGSKGVHAPAIALFEARHCAMQTYLVVGDLLRFEDDEE